MPIECYANRSIYSQRIDVLFPDIRVTGIPTQPSQPIALLLFLKSYKHWWYFTLINTWGGGGELPSNYFHGISNGCKCSFLVLLLKSSLLSKFQVAFQVQFTSTTVFFRALSDKLYELYFNA